MITRLLAAALALVTVWGTSGCVAIKTYNGPHPVSPSQTFILSPRIAKRVDTLRPTFKWQPTRPGDRYELAIWESMDMAVTDFTHGRGAGPASR